ncbi:rhodanese domain protein [Halomonas elongata DSM 2581]|uniref:Rhodanese domain protein n=2 Tax=Halomonas elongata (strain ATCC 33173 / DSM 2581 / NBRC 15536 / NCIMB 2198 / 1H9) TaxID=768066 RepID=E1V3D8_HALED|nr:rhodanese domain protein [Halomonas elongata DSM 2581]
MWRSMLTTALLMLGMSPALAADVPPLVTADWLAQRLGDDNLVVLDVRSGIDEGGDRGSFEAAHIPGSLYSSYTDDGWRETRDGVSGLLPPISSLERLIGGLGIGNDDTVVIVPAGTGPTDFGSAARVYWTFKVLSHDEVAILDGGFAGWKAQGHEVASGTSERPEFADFQGQLREDLLATADEVTSARERGSQLVDARPADYFRGENQSPAATAPGTIPGSRNLPHQTLLGENQQAWYLGQDVIQSRIREAGLQGDRPTVSFCNTGHWAATDWFVLSEIAGFDDVSLYDGSMAEWTQDEERPLAVAKRGLGKVLEFFGLGS